jgi:hypothetical protein
LTIYVITIPKAATKTVSITIKNWQILKCATYKKNKLKCALRIYDKRIELHMKILFLKVIHSIF